MSRRRSVSVIRGWRQEREIKEVLNPWFVETYLGWQLENAEWLRETVPGGRRHEKLLLAAPIIHTDRLREGLMPSSWHKSLTCCRSQQKVTSHLINITWNPQRKHPFKKYFFLRHINFPLLRISSALNRPCEQTVSALKWSLFVANLANLNVGLMSNQSTGNSANDGYKTNYFIILILFSFHKLKQRNSHDSPAAKYSTYKLSFANPKHDAKSNKEICRVPGKLNFQSTPRRWTRCYDKAFSAHVRTVNGVNRPGAWEETGVSAGCGALSADRAVLRQHSQTATTPTTDWEFRGCFLLQFNIFS